MTQLPWACTPHAAGDSEHELLGCGRPAGLCTFLAHSYCSGKICRALDGSLTHVTGLYLLSVCTQGSCTLNFTEEGRAQGRLPEDM